MAGKARLLSDVIEKALTSDENNRGSREQWPLTFLMTPIFRKLEANLSSDFFAKVKLHARYNLLSWVGGQTDRHDVGSYHWFWLPLLCARSWHVIFMFFVQFQRQKLFDSLCNQSSHVHLSEMDPWEFDLCSSTRVQKTPEWEYQLHVQVSSFLSVACLVSSAVPLTACYIDSFNPVASGPLSIKTVGHNKQKCQINERETRHQHLLHRKILLLL